MYCGQIVETGMVDEIFTQPIHPYTRGLMECIPAPGKTRPGQPLGSIPGIVPSPIGDLWGCSFRNRCSRVVAACAQKGLEKTILSPTRFFRCVNPGVDVDKKPGQSETGGI
jgi:peptide/nickel transport system ATP-binding protein